MPFDVAYVSPHPDDVAFSAAARVDRDVAAGRRVLVHTLFEVEDAPTALTSAEDRARVAGFLGRGARLAEDARFAAAFRVEVRSAGLVDALFRERPASFDELFRRLQADELAAGEPLVEAIAASLSRLVDEGVRELVAPLGIGHHVDHQLAHAAARLTAARRGVPLVCYEDTPYVLSPGALESRLRILDPARPELVAADGVARKLEAVAAYPTQWPQFYPSLEAWGAALSTYAATLGPAAAVERAWRF